MLPDKICNLGRLIGAIALRPVRYKIAVERIGQAIAARQATKEDRDQAEAWGHLHGGAATAG